ncbi:MAG: potassium channel family protein [Prochlorotrichaceae cyanobacterium]
MGFSFSFLDDRFFFPAEVMDQATDQFLVCGLGSVGQHCAAILKDFGVVVHVIERVEPTEWEIPNLLGHLDGFYLGDCRHTEILEAAQIRYCRAALLVTADDRINIEAGLAARSLNPNIRLVVRSAKANLNALLEQQLGNYVSFEPTELSAPAFAFAALNSQTLGFFRLNDALFEVVQHVIDRHHPWLNHNSLQNLQKRHCRILRHYRPHNTEAVLDGDHSDQFHGWDPDTPIQVGDHIITIEATERSFTADEPPVLRDGEQAWPERWILPWFRRSHWRHQFESWKALWRDRYGQQIWRVLILCGITILSLLLGGTVLMWRHYPDISLGKAFLTTIVLLLGGYGDVFGEITLRSPLPWPMQAFSLSLTLAGTAFVGVLYALLTERLLTLRFQFFQRRLPIPKQDHVVIVGLGRVGQRVAELLQTFHQPFVAIVATEPEAKLWSQMPMVVSSINAGLSKVYLEQARSVLAMTESEMDNLEVALMANATNPKTGLVIRTYHRRFRDTVATLFADTQVLCASELAAEAFAAAAFGENVLSLFRLEHQTILVTDYTIEMGDTLNGLLLSEVAYGYGVVPIFHARDAYQSAQPMPSDDLRLQEGDRMVVLATIEGLKFIEKGQLLPPCWKVLVAEARHSDASFQGANEIACITGCSIAAARNLMATLPQLLPTPLYRHQAFRLVRRLRKAQVSAQALPCKLESPVSNAMSR